MSNSPVRLTPAAWLCCGLVLSFTTHAADLKVLTAGAFKPVLQALVRVSSSAPGTS